MTLAEQIIAFSGTGAGSLLIGWWINKKKDDIEVTLKEQVFYKTLISDMEAERVKAQAEYQTKITALTNEVHELKDSIIKLVEVKKEKDKTIEQLRRERQLWEDTATNERHKLEIIVKQKDKQISKLFKQVEIHESK
jgi:hypothetical protein